VHEPASDRSPGVASPSRAPVSLLRFTADRDERLKAESGTGRYLIVDYGREGWDATFVPLSGAELTVPPVKGGRFHAGRRHAIAACQDHHERTTQPAADSGGPQGL
jgi:hypothetical protein